MKLGSVRKGRSVAAWMIVALFLLSSIAVANAAAPAAAAMPAGPSVAASPASSAPPAVASPTVAATPSAGGGPHPGTLQNYEVVPGGAPTIDPAVAYYTPDDEVISNIYEALIGYNGTQAGPLAGNYTPVLATCVPGSGECSKQFGSTLVYNNASTGQPQYYSFEIDSKARFYDPSTGVSWPVYPSDVVFSFARTLSFADLPYAEWFNGWINAQALLPPGSDTWDLYHGIPVHAPYNNTPNHVLSAFLVNDSAYCPTSVTVTTNGCVTFNVGASGLAWPYFLELVADPLGGSVTPCGTFTYLDSGLPGFAGTNAARGDGPCLLPGGATSTSQVSFQNYLRSVSPTAWDAVQELAAPAPLSPQPGVQFTAIGSGPYYEVSLSVSGGEGGSGGYDLAANPAYVAPQGCAGATYCLPLAGHYIAKVDVIWENDDTLGLQAMIAGQADSAGYSVGDTSTILSLERQGKYGLLTNVTGGSNWFAPFELNFSLTAEKANDPDKLLNVPSNFFSSLSLRQFLVHAYPYANILSSVWTVDGVPYAANWGGAIPPAQSTYYDAAIPWPSGNPDTNPSDVNGAAWWWAQATTPSSAYYDAQLASCTSGTPCKFPIIAWVGNPSLDNAMSDWMSEISSLTGGALAPYSFDQTGSQYITNGALANGAGNMPIYNWGWVPDYQDPTDYLGPMWAPNGTFSGSMALGSQMYQAPYNAGACGHSSYSAANLSYWATKGELTTACQGVAYQVMLGAMAAAAHDSDQATRVALYQNASWIGNELALMTYEYIAVNAFDYGSWLSPAGINTNPSVGGGQVQTWFTWEYASTVFPVYFNETGLTSGTQFSVTLNGVTQTATAGASSGSILFSGVANGSYSYSVGFVNGYGATPSNGTVKVAGAKVSVSLKYTGFTPPEYTATFTEKGLVSGTNWTVIVQNVGALTGNSSGSDGETLAFALPTGSYNYSPGLVIGYTASPNGSFTVVPIVGVNVSVTYTPIFPVYTVEFKATGLPAATAWSVSIGPYTITSTSPNVTFWEPNGTYRAGFTPPAGYSAPIASADFLVRGANLVFTVPLTSTAKTYVVTFTQTGLASGTQWNVTLAESAGLLATSTGSSIVFHLPNGTYNWSVETIGGYTTGTFTGNVTVNGAPGAVPITFVVYTYTVTFFEGGLPSGTLWNVTIGAKSYNSTTYFITLSLGNGTTPFTVDAPKGFVANPASGNVTVNAAPATQVIIFTLVPATFTVTFSAPSLPAGQTWTVFFAGINHTSGTTSIAFTVTNGTWTYAVVGPSGYTASPSGGQVQVNGAAKTVSVAFQSSSKAAASPSWTYLGPLAYGLIGLFVALALVGLVLASLAGRRKAGGTPPEAWSETKGTKGKDGSSDDMEDEEPETPPSR